MILSNVLTFGKFYVSRKPIINGGAIRPVGLLLMYLVSSYLAFLSSQPHPHHHPNRPSLAKSERAEKWS